MTTVSRPSWHTRVASACGGVAIAAFVLLHLLMGSTVDALRQPVSTYALTTPGTVLFPVGTLGLAVACALLAVRGIAVPRPAWVRWPLLAAAAMLVLVVTFRTDTTDSVSSIGGEIHRWAAGAAFGLLSVACLAVAVQARRCRLGRWPAWCTGASLVLLAAIIANTFAPEFAASDAWRGVPQRALLAVQTGFVVLLALSNHRIVRRTVPAQRFSSVSPSVPAGVGVNTGTPARWALWTETLLKPEDAKLWLSGRGDRTRRALPSGNGLRPSAVRRQ